VGIEMNPEYFSLCLNRIKALDADAAANASLGQSLANELKAMGG